MDPFKERRGSSKANMDATLMSMNQDRMQNGRLKAGYNVHISTETKPQSLQFLPHKLGADAGFRCWRLLIQPPLVTGKGPKARPWRAFSFSHA